MQTFSNSLIDTMGGTTAVSKLSKTPLSTVHSWRKNGIPDARLDHLKLIAEREGIAIDWETGRAAEHAATATIDGQAQSSGTSADISQQVSA